MQQELNEAKGLQVCAGRHVPCGVCQSVCRPRVPVMILRQLFLQVLLTVLGNGIGRVRGEVTEVGSTGELYDVLLSADQYSFVYIHSGKCQQCHELTPKFIQLEALFGGRVNFVMIDGRKSRNLGKDFNVVSYPHMLLFEPLQDVQHLYQSAEISPKHLVKGIYQGKKEVSDMAYYLTELTGQVPDWPEALSANVAKLDSPRSMDRFYAALNGYWSHAFGVDVGKCEDGRPVLLSFTTPWMDTSYQNMFRSGLPLSLVDGLANLFSETLAVFTIDGSLASMSDMSNILRVMNFPSFVILPQGANQLRSEVVSVEFHKYDREVLKSELETVKRLVELCLSDDLSDLVNYANKFHSVHVYESLEHMQQKINGTGQVFDADSDSAEMNVLYRTIRDM